MSMIFHAKRRLSKCKGSWVVVIKYKVHFKLQPPAMFVFFSCHKSGVIKSCSFSEYLSECKILWSYVGWCKFWTHPSSLNVRHFGTALKIMASSSFSMAWPAYWISQKQQICSKDDMKERHRNMMLYSLAYISFRKKRRLKICRLRNTESLVDS
jgi:hypothetical protein